MKKLMFALCAAATITAFAEEEKKPVAEVEQENSAPIIWGFANYGIYSGYQLYGSLVNREPTLQGYAEVNANLLFGDLDLGYVGGGIWSNSDLTKQRDRSYGRAFNEWDFNVHWGRTFWFDDEKTWGLDYRASVVWYEYPHHLYQRHKKNGKTDTTMDFNHSFSLLNPYLIPFIDVIREYHENDANLLQFGVKKPFQLTDDFSLCPSLTFVWRENRYNWCFPTRFGGAPANSGLATMKLQLDATYMFTKNFGVFGKVAYCSIIDDDLRDNCDMFGRREYGKLKDFAWGGVGICCNF